MINSAQFPNYANQKLIVYEQLLVNGRAHYRLGDPNAGPFFGMIYALFDFTIVFSWPSSPIDPTD